MALIGLQAVEKFYGGRAVHKIVEVRDGELHRYEGGYSAWRESRERVTTGSGRL